MQNSLDNIFLNREKWLLVFLAANVITTLMHYVDNIIYLEVYPDLPTTRVISIISFWLVMTPFGVLGYLFYRKGVYRLAFYSLYLYCILNIAVLGHYLRAPITEITFKINLLIWLEVITAVLLSLFVVWLHTHQQGPNRGDLRDG